MKEMYRIIKFPNLESSTFEKGFCERPTEFLGGYVYFTYRIPTNLKIYLGKPDISFKFNSDKNIISRV